MHKPFHLLAMLTATLLFMISPLQAEENALTQLQEKIEAFKTSDQYIFSRQTIIRANAYLGAAMLAEEQEKIADASIALEQATAKLSEAKQTATAFTTHFATLINTRQEAIDVLQVISSSGHITDQFTIKIITKSAQQEFEHSIRSHEKGKLNQTREHAAKAQELFDEVIVKTVPRLTELTASAIGHAANSGGKKYAPQLYQSAKDKLAELRAFGDGLSRQTPSHPEQGLLLAYEAKRMAEQVKLWRKKKGSHEMIVLKQRHLNLQLANALNINTSNNAMLINISDNDLLTAIQTNKQTLTDERQAHQQAIAQLKKNSAIELKRQLTAQNHTMKQVQQQQTSTIKDAFRAKLERSRVKLEQSHAQLERETFDTKRQTKLHHIFKKGEVDILVNLDGSLLIRLSSMKFAPGKSKIDAKYFDMLGRLSQAMSLYQERNLRIEGHTDNLGDVKPNQVLSLKRAEAVRDFLISSGSEGRRLKALGYGEVRPIASNDFPQGRTMNRRIDVVINAVK